MLYIKREVDGSTRYPYTVDQLKVDYPNVSFANALTPEVLKDFNVYVVTMTMPSEYDPSTQKAVEGIPQHDSETDSWRQTWNIVDLTDEEKTAIALETASKLEADRNAYLIQIDADVDVIYGRVVGNRAQEYLTAESEASAFIASGYSGNVPSSVSSWAVAKGWTAKEAADDIAKTATEWRYAQTTIRAARLLRKEQVRTAADATSLKNVVSSWNGFVVAIRGQLGITD